MSLPKLIEIVPLAGPVRAEITVPGSKSITNRALILAALATSRTTLHGALWSEDTQLMVEALRTLGFGIEVSPDAHEPGNRTLVVLGGGGSIPRAGSAEQPLDLFVGNAGTAARFLAALVCLGRGVYRLHGVPRMHERPQAALFTALEQLGYHVEATAGRLPAVIHGTGPRPAHCTVSVAESSQFASALLLAGVKGGWSVSVTDANDDELPYVEMTRQLAAIFPRHGGEFVIEPDASSGSYFWALNELPNPACARPHDVRVTRWPVSGWQIDAEFPKFLPLARELSRRTQLGDSIMTAIVLAPLAGHAVHFLDLGRLRVQECERVAALRRELTRCGARVEEAGDTLTVHPSELHGAEIETYADHRLAMCFATLGLRVPGLKLKNPACVKKTFPNFFQKLAAAPPHGVGAVIRDGHSGRVLAGEDLLPA
jgi:3-phosphoshikimate 1-carboxyvinyltransferase